MRLSSAGLYVGPLVTLTPHLSLTGHGHLLLIFMLRPPLWLTSFFGAGAPSHLSHTLAMGGQPETRAGQPGRVLHPRGPGVALSKVWDPEVEPAEGPR